MNKVYIVVYEIPYKNREIIDVFKTLKSAQVKLKESASFGWEQIGPDTYINCDIKLTIVEHDVQE